MSVSSNRTTLFAIFLFIFIGSLVYSNTLNVPFHFDDANNIKNPALRIENASVDEVLKALSTGTLKKRPVSNVSFAFNYYLGGYRVQGYHLVNISIHLFAGIFLYLLLRATLALPVNKEKYGSFPGLAFVTTLLWLVHPLGTQSVTYLVQRMNSLAAMFYILALLLYVMGRKRMMRAERRQASIPAWAWFFASGFSGLLAIGSKEIAATLPMIIFIYEWYFFQDLRWEWLRKKFYWLMGVVVLFGSMAYFYLGKIPWQVFLSDCPTRDFTAYERLLTQFRVVMHYISLLLYPNPNRLALDYNFPFSTSVIAPITTLYSLIGLVFFLLLVVLLARRERLLSFCILWFLGNLVIESSVICLEIIFEHRTYLPSMFFLLFVVTLLYRIGVNRKILSSMFVLLIFFFGIWTYDRNKVWNDPVALWSHDVALYPDNARSHNNLGLALTKTGKREQAEKEYRQALEIDPKAEVANNNLGSLLLLQDKRKEAEFYFREAVRCDPRYVQARFNLGVLLRENGEYEEAISHFRIALEKDPDDRVLHKNLGNTLLRSGNPKEALPHLRKARLKAPKDTEVLLDVAESLTQLGQGEQAISVYRKVLAIDNQQMSAHYNLALLLQQKGGSEEALSHYRSAERLAKYPAAMLYNFGNQLFRLDRFMEAEKIYRKFLNITPTFINTYNNLGLVLLRQGRYKEAVQCFAIAVRISPNYQLAYNNLKRATELMEGEIKDKTGGEQEGGE